MCSILMQIWHWEIMKKIIWRPATIRRMAEDLALLPIWYAQPGEWGTGLLPPDNADYLKRDATVVPAGCAFGDRAGAARLC